MKFLLLLIASSAFASQSIVMTAAFIAHATTPVGASPWTSVTDLRVEGCVVGLVPTVGNSRLFDEESGGGLFSSTTALEFRGFGGSTGPGFNSLTVPEIATVTSFRWRFQRIALDSSEHLEVWDEITGSYYHSQIADPSPAPRAFANKQIGPGSISGFVPSAATNLGCLRISNVILAIGSTLPDRFITTGFGNMGNWEFEGVLTDQSGLGLTIGVTAGGTSYLNPTTTYAPVILLNSVPLSTRASVSTPLSISGFTNSDNPAFICTLKQNSGPAQALFDKTGCAPSFTGPVFGNYNLTTSITDSLSVSSSSAFDVGSVATDANCSVVFPDARIGRLIGPSTRHGCNSWSWYDDRAKAMIDMQVGMLDGSSPASVDPWRNRWDVASTNGTITVINGNAVVAGSGTQFQTDFCGGPGNTSPAFGTEVLVVWYDSADYPFASTGTYGRGFYPIVSCDSQTQVTLRFPWGHATGTQAGRSYSVGNPQLTGYGWFPNTNTPGNYYDNALGIWAMYYRTGLNKYRDAARTLSRNWWTGPNYDRGKNYDTGAPVGAGQLGGNFIAAGPARGQAPVGLVIWALESGEDIWPGIHHLWDWEKFISHDSPASVSWLEQIGDVREVGYATGMMALCAQYDTDATYRSTCTTALKETVNLFWAPRQVTGAGNGNWHQSQTPSGSRVFLDVSGTVFVTVANGSPNITLSGRTWSQIDFTFHGVCSTAGTAVTRTSGLAFNVAWVGNAFVISGVSYTVATFIDADHLTLTTSAGTQASAKYSQGETIAGVIFIASPTNTLLCCNQNSQVGDTVYYTPTYVDSTHATLDRNYAGTSGNKGMLSANLVGFGTQPFMQGIWGGQAGTFIYDALINCGVTCAAEAAIVRQFAIDSALWLISTSDPAVHAVYYGADYVNCTPPGSDPAHCAAALEINGEIFKNLSSAYLFTLDPTIKTGADSFFTGAWCKPTGGWTCGTAGYGTYMTGANDYPAGYMSNPIDPLANKWMGVMHGIGGGYQWSSARIGGVLPADPLTLTTSGVIPTGGAKIRLTVQAPDGTITVGTPCSGSAGTAVGCSWTGDRREGNHLLKVEYLTAGDVLIGPGSYQTINVQ